MNIAVITIFILLGAFIPFLIEMILEMLGWTITIKTKSPKEKLDERLLYIEKRLNDHSDILFLDQKAIERIEKQLIVLKEQKRAKK